MAKYKIASIVAEAEVEVEGKDDIQDKVIKILADKYLTIDQSNYGEYKENPNYCKRVYLYLYSEKKKEWKMIRSLGLVPFKHKHFWYCDKRVKIPEFKFLECFEPLKPDMQTVCDHCCDSDIDVDSESIGEVFQWLMNNGFNISIGSKDTLIYLNKNKVED